MNRIVLLFVMVLLIATEGIAQFRISLSLSAGCDENSHKYYSPVNYLKFEDAKTDYNLGLSLGYRLSDIVRARMEFQYATLNYGHQFLNSIELSKSEMTLNTLSFNPKVDFKFFTFSNFNFYLTTGLRFEYVLNADQETMRTDGEVSEYNYISTDYDDSWIGIGGGLILKYNVSKHLGIIASPEYNYYFNKIYYKNDGTLKRCSANMGIEWIF